MSENYINVAPLPGETIDESYKIFQVLGDSMSPGIKPGAMCLVKEIPSNKWSEVEGVAIFKTDENTIIRRVADNRIDTAGRIHLIPDNPVYSAKILTLCEIRAVYKAIRKIHEYID